MEGKLRINVILNGGKVSSILQILAKYLDKDSKFNFNQDELSASISYDYAEPPVEIFEAIASNENCSAKIEIGNEQDFLSEKEEESSTQLETSHESYGESEKDSASDRVLKTAEKADVCEILKDVAYVKTNAVFKNKLSELFGFNRGIRSKVVNKDTVKENIEELSESKKPKVSEDTLNHFVVNWFKEKKGVCCGLERFLQLLRREFRHIKL